MHDVFLSHAREDNERIRPLADALERGGLDVWWDAELRGGSTYAAELEARVKDARCILVCWSRSAVSADRHWIRSEANKGRERGVLVSVLLDDVALPMPFDQIQAIRLVDWDSDPSYPDFRKLVDDIRSMIERTSRTSEPPSSRRGKKRALLIGVSGYAPESGLATLPAARGNVEDLERALKQKACGFDVTSLRDPVRQDIENELEGFFAGSGPEDLLLLYYTGHVLMTDAKSLQLTAKDTRPDRSKATTIAVSRLGEDFVNPCAAGQVLMILDACYGDARAEDVASAFQTHLGSGRSLVVIASRPDSGVGKDVWDEKRSLVTGLLINAIDSDTADSNHDGVVTVEEIVQYLNKGSVSDSKADPTVLNWTFRTTPSQMEIRGRGTNGGLPPTPDQRRFITMFAPELERGKIIPFLGDGVYGDGPLSFFRIARALAEKAGLSAEKRQDMIATTAESLELHLQDRSEFLRELREVLTQQSAACVPPVAHNLILEMKSPWLVVSVNYDNLLEHQLDELGKPYLVVCHVLRSGGDEDESTKNEDAGKILVIRSKNHPEVKRDPEREIELCAPDKLVLGSEDCVIYRLLGSPFLHDRSLVERRRLDTVVITETDHIDFLVHLREASTGVPSAFSTLFKVRNLLFLEYNLDIWHYRLIGHIFRRPDAERALPGSVLLKKTPYVLRTAASPTEELFWKRRFNPDRVPMDLTTFVRALRAARGEPR